MDDLISRQAAIESFMYDDDGTPWSMDDIVYRLEQFPSAQPEQRWIPCSERLPEKEGRYLVTCSRWGAWEVDWNIWHNKPNPSWFWEESVTAWMPLPEPYKEDEE